MIDYSKGLLTGETITTGDRLVGIMHPCDCGAVHNLKLHHYDRVLLKCGRMVWAIQPRAYGPLEIRPWPGPPMSSRELAAKEAGERAEGWQAGRWAA